MTEETVEDCRITLAYLSSLRVKTIAECLTVGSVSGLAFVCMHVCICLYVCMYCVCIPVCMFVFVSFYFQALLLCCFMHVHPHSAGY